MVFNPHAHKKPEYKIRDKEGMGFWATLIFIYVPIFCILLVVRAIMLINGITIMRLYMVDEWVRKLIYFAQNFLASH